MRDSLSEFDEPLDRISILFGWYQLFAQNERVKLELK